MMALSDSSFLSSSWDHGQCGSDMSHDAPSDLENGSRHKVAAWAGRADRHAAVQHDSSKQGAARMCDAVFAKSVIPLASCLARRIQQHLQDIADCTFAGNRQRNTACRQGV